MQLSMSPSMQSIYKSGSRCNTSNVKSCIRPAPPPSPFPEGQHGSRYRRSPETLKDKYERRLSPFAKNSEIQVSIASTVQLHLLTPNLIPFFFFYPFFFKRQRPVSRAAYQYNFIPLINSNNNNNNNSSNSNNPVPGGYVYVGLIRKQTTIGLGTDGRTDGQDE